MENETSVTGPEFAGQLVTKAKAAEFLAASEKTLDREIDAGELPVVTVRGGVRLKVADLNAYVERNTVVKKPPGNRRKE